MTVYFNEEEREWLIKEVNNWHVKDGCPEPLCSRIQQKLNYIYRPQISQNNLAVSKNNERESFRDSMNNGIDSCLIK